LNNKKKYNSLQLIFLLLCLNDFIFCQDSIYKAGVEIHVATSIFPIFDITKNIAGDKVNIFFVVPIGANPHIYEPVPSLVKKLQRVQLFIGTHEDMDHWIENFLSQNTIIKYIYNKPKEKMETETHHITNPHIWITVKGTMKLAEKIAGYLSMLYPENSQNFYKNLNNYLHELHLLDQKILTLFKSVHNKKFIQWHPAWNFFAQDYGLEITATIEHGHGDKPSVRNIKNVIEHAKKGKVKIIVIGLNQQSKEAEILAKEIDAKLVQLDTIGDPKDQNKSSFIRLMYNNAKILAEALNQ
jgi:zinc transport system substrate-binding protein